MAPFRSKPCVCVWGGGGGGGVCVCVCVCVGDEYVWVSGDRYHS